MLSYVIHKAYLSIIYMLHFVFVYPQHSTVLYVLFSYAVKYMSNLPLCIVVLGILHWVLPGRLIFCCC